MLVFFGYPPYRDPQGSTEASTHDPSLGLPGGGGAQS